MNTSGLAGLAGLAWLAWAGWVAASSFVQPASVASARLVSVLDGSAPGVSSAQSGAAPTTGRSNQQKRARRALALALVALLVHPFLALIVAGWWVRGLVSHRREAAASQAARLAAVPEAADLFVVALSAGLTVRNAVHGVGEVAPGPLAVDLRAAGRSLSQGDSVACVLARWSGSDHPLAPVGAALAAADRSGAAATPLLARCADQQRELARRSAEAQVRRLPVRLLGPLVLCILPALIVATFGPLVVVSLQQLGEAVP